MQKGVQGLPAAIMQGLDQVAGIQGLQHGGIVHHPELIRLDLLQQAKPVQWIVVAGPGMQPVEVAPEVRRQLREAMLGETGRLQAQQPLVQVRCLRRQPVEAGGGAVQGDGQQLDHARGQDIGDLAQGLGGWEPRIGAIRRRLNGHDVAALGHRRCKAWGRRTGSWP